MTDKHPLTDDKCFEIWSGNLYENEWMRAAADWQLEQAVEWLKGNLGSSMYLQLVEDNVLGKSGTEVNVGYVIQHLREEMRPL